MLRNDFQYVLINRENNMEHPGIDTNPTGKWNEEELIKQAQDDLSKFDLIFEHYFDRVFAFVFSRTNNRQIAEDLTSQIFLKILQALPRYKNRGTFAAWVFKIARNTVIDYYRSPFHKATISLNEFDAFEFHQQGRSHEISTNSDRLIDLERGLKQLSTKDQELLSLRFAASLSYKEIGEIKGKNPGAIKMAIHRIFRKLKERMERTNDRN
ncbi:MAG: RNA polymerase sigma factor [Chloroflexota bacterium]|nr:RNA polymerase sigma factor [Chloroflexota bacterium]